ncbi:hypothetical protein [Gorillibacterium timonense]|uniref:hypothetical protein n=1 Tax=Gorillibacterium timonense TaxID=1689269 RepID=UPI00071D9846|nr:hypothetical protein [Gorillibacterium timonense]
MTKLLQGLAKLIIGTIFVSGLTLSVTWLTLHTYIDKLLASYNIEVPDTGVGDLFGFGDSKKADIPAKQAELPANGSEAGTGGEGSTEDKKDRVQSLSSQGASGSGASLALSSKELIALKEKMTEPDKAAMMALLMKIPEARLQELTALLEGGLTEAELAEMKNRAKQDLSAEEFDQLLHILNKYE